MSTCLKRKIYICLFECISAKLFYADQCKIRRKNRFLDSYPYTCNANNEMFP